jgi:hypothetical protein
VQGAQVAGLDRRAVGPAIPAGHLGAVAAGIPLPKPLELVL